MPKITKVVCLGGGYLAIRLAKTLRSAIRRGDLQLTIIDRNNFHVFHGLVAEMVSGKLAPTSIISPSRQIFAPAQFYNAEIERVDWDNHQVTVSRATDGRQFIIPYDHIVLDIGTEDNLSIYPGLAENAFRLRNYSDAFNLRNHLPQMFELAEIENDPEERRRLLTFVVAGGNYAGVEVATELACYGYSVTKKKFSGISREEIHVVLVHSQTALLPELSERYSNIAIYTANALKKQGIEVKTGTTIVSATPEEAILSNGEHILTRTIVSCAGTAPNPLVSKWSFECDQLGRIQTDNNLNVIGNANIWAGGDCASMPHPKGGTCPSLALYALHAGSTIGKNILHSIKQGSLMSYRFSGYGDAVSLSNHVGIIQLKGFQLKGFLGWLTWRFVMLYIMPWDRRLRVVADSVTTTLFGRDIVNMQPQQKLAIIEKYFDKDQTIIKEGEMGDCMYFLKSGEVRVITNCGTEQEKQVAALKEGSHFGEVAVFNRCRRTATIIAATPVTVLEIKRETAQALSIPFAHIKEISKKF